MRRITRTTAAAVAVCLGIAVPARAAFADDASATPSPDVTPTVTVQNAAVSVNSTDNTSVFHLAFRIVHSSGTNVDVSNVALAVTDCVNCRSTAIAIEVDLVWPVPTVLAATNVAVAVNSGCATCDALAAAFQYVVASDQRMRLTETGRREVREIEHELAGLQAADVTQSDLTSQVDALAAELGQVLATELVPVHHHHHRDGGDHQPSPRRDDDGRDGDA
jgi:hypothetical protein